MNLRNANGTTLRIRIVREAIIASRFILVGIAATGMHLFVLWLLIFTTTFPTLLANLFAFLAAFGVSFAGHYIWTFSSPGEPYQAVRRFLLISISAFLFNSVLLAGLLSTEWLKPMHAAMLSVAAIPALTFLGSRLWAFGIRLPRKDNC
jgi:putative flippase GtrA